MTTAEQEARENFERWVKDTGSFTDWSRYGDGYAKPLVDRTWRAWCAALSSRDEALSAAKAEVERLSEIVDLLESNARIQARLLADTGRAKEASEAREAEARKVIERLRDTADAAAQTFNVGIMDAAIKDATAFLSPPSPEPSKDGTGEWRSIEDRPDFDNLPCRHFIRIEGSTHHSGVNWRRIHFGDAYIRKPGTDDEFLGYRKSDILRLCRDGDMDPLTTRVTHWRPAIFADTPSQFQRSEGK